MKVTVLIVMMLALTGGVVYAESSTTEAEAPLYNGITYFDVGPAPDCWSVRGAAAGGYIPESEPALMNGVTHFEPAVPGSFPTGLCAGRLSEEPEVWVNNGITVFHE